MKVKALRGVCVGVGRDLNPGDLADLDPATVQFLTAIGAVAPVVDEPVPEVIETKSKSAKAGSKEKSHVE
jgi:hypothetical protein